MEMHQVRYFLAAARELSFTRAAEACRVSQPALTTAIRKLEAQVEAPLFHRDGHRLVLTDVGRRLLPHFTRISEETEAVATLARDFRLLNQVPLRLGVMTTVGPSAVAGLLAAFGRSTPGVEVAVRDGAPEALAALLDAGEIDAAILNPMEGLGEAFHAEPLYEEGYVAVFPPGQGPGGNAVGLGDLSGLPYVDRLACEMREMVMAVCRDRQVSLYARFRAEREDWVQAMVAAGLGFAFMPEFAVTRPDLDRRALVDPAVARTVALATRRGRRHSPALSAFAAAARTHRWREARAE